MGFWSRLFGKKTTQTEDKPTNVLRDGEHRHYVEYHITRKRISPPTPTDARKDDDFATSALVAYATDSTLLGTLAGGDIVGAMIGDSLNDSDSRRSYDCGSSDSYDSGSSYDSGCSDSYDSGGSDCGGSSGD